jgi:hypothetical protein
LIGVVLPLHYIQHDWAGRQELNLN